MFTITFKTKHNDKHAKQEIRELLDAYVSRFPSQAKAFDTIKNVSEATLINMRKGKWESISEALWRTVGAQVGYSIKGNWQTVETRDYKTLKTLFDDAKTYSNVFAIVAAAGSGKTYVSRHYQATHSNVYHIVCAEYFNKKVFLGKLLAQMGKDNTGTIAEMMDTVIDTMMAQDAPLIIIDEADKLPDQVLYFFITLYNMLQGQCGIVLLATDYLSKRIERGKRLKRKGYAEIFSRIGRRFVSLPGTDEAEVQAICHANGLMDALAIKSIYNEYEGDLRRVERAVHREMMKLSQQGA